MSITLITGDKLLVNAGGTVVNAQPAPGREHIPLSTTRENGRTHVVPVDVTPLLAAGKLDKRLFDVNTLLEFGYDDAHVNQLPLIIGGHGVMAARSAESWRALSTSPEMTGPGKIWLDGIRKPVLDRSAAQIGAPAAWREGITGRDVKVAVLDTGIDGNHPDLKGKEVAERNFTNDPDNTDKVGHGTHVASTVASTDSKYRGIAPDAQLMDGKVCETNQCADSAILEGMRWAAEQGADVVNLSLGGTDTPEIDPLEEAVNELSARYGTLFVIAAGNSGGKETVASPGSADAALTVGAVDRDDNIAPFSSRGPRVGDGAIKPDVTAPGVGIVAAKAGTTDHIAFSGTSMATPHVAGAAALLKQENPDWTGSQVKAALISSAKPTANLTPFEQGAGRIDVARAITQTVTAEPGNLHLGFQSFPHNDDKPLNKPVTYVNPTEDPITFAVSVKTSAPSGLFAAGTSTVTVPAGGKASVPVIADTRVSAAGGLFTAVVTATAGDLVLRTPVSVNSEVESYDVTFSYLDRDGKPTANYSPYLIGFDTDKRPSLYDPNGKITVRVPKGNYSTHASIRTGPNYDIVARPNLLITANTTVVLDARTTKPLEVTFPSETTGWPSGDISWVRSRNNLTAVNSMLFFGGFSNVGIAHLGDSLPDTEFSMSIGSQARLAGEELAYYRFAWERSGSLPTGFVRHPRKEDLARIENSIGQQEPGKQYYKGMYPVYQRGGLRTTSLFTVPGGAKPVEYVTTDSGWQPLVYQLGSGTFVFDVSQTGLPRTYRPSERVTERLNYAVFGPSIPTGLSMGRFNNTFYAYAPMLTDSGGGSGSSKQTSATSALYRNDVKVYETPRAGYAYTEVPSEAADFRLETHLTRPFEFSTEVSAKWTFRSAYTNGTYYTPVPMSVLRFTPKLDDANALRAGRLQRIPLVVEQQAGADQGRVRSIEVESSFDDGKTWRRAGVVGTSALIYHPDAEGYVSLRGRTTDTKGNTSEITIIRAYKVTR
ncbi:S8 family peptidase [Lentzea tibetensis]|uniref:S8 family peptidase n=1 Tax=Lentzea tibetensis TaxID=2591470 RepID=UPI001648BD38|nr:S8 family serine peptidase [Lentzea tibetensis]